MDINWKSYLDYYFPSIGKVYLNSVDMKKVNVKIQKRNDILSGEKRQSAIATTFYDLFIMVVHSEIGTTREKEVAFKFYNVLKYLSVINDTNNTIAKFLFNQKPPTQTPQYSAPRY